MASEINFENLPSVLQRVLRLLGTPLEQKTRGDTIFPYINELAQEFKALGAEDVEVNPYGVLFASLPQKGPRNAPKLGFLASYGRLTHEVPNAPDWKLLRYHGENIAIDPLQDVVLSNKRLPELSRFLGEELLVSAGARPLNLTTRVGIAMMLGILEHFQKHPDLEHAALRFAVVPETLIAGGEKYFDLERFGADYAYELVAPGLGTLVTECFNAARAVVTLRGKDVFPGYGKDRLVSAIRLMHDFIDDLPRDELPERTEGHEGYYHPVHLSLIHISEPTRPY